MKLPLFGIGMQGATPVITAKRMQNFYIEQRPQGEKTQVVALGVPGLDLFATFSDRIRGMLPIEQNNLLYVVTGGTFWQIDASGVKTSRGSLLTTTGNVMLAHNGTQVMVVDGTYGYIYNSSTLAFAQITDVDFPASPQSVTFQDGYFTIGLDDGKFYISAPYNGLAWDALDFATAESDPDRLVRVFADHGELILFGDISTEFHTNIGATDFPYARVQGANAEWGLAARYSAVKFDDSVAFLCKNRMGQVLVGKLKGHAFEKLSTPDIDKTLNAYATHADATAFSYLLGGHAMYQINFPAEGESWLFDGLTGHWSNVKSQNITRQRCEWGVQFITRTILADYSNGNLYTLNNDTFTENGEMIEGEIIGEHWDSELMRINIDRIRIDMETGVGEVSGQGENPHIMLSLSRDGGKTWGVERWRPLGRQGEYTGRVDWRRNGQFTRATAKIRITDPVRRIILGAYVNPQD